MTDVYTPDLSTYGQMVQRLAKPGEAIVKSLTAWNADLLHMALGLAGEAIELVQAVEKGDKPNTLEELGDAKFYATHIVQLLTNSSRPEAVVTARERYAMDLLYLSGDILDMAKGLAVYNKPGYYADTLPEGVVKYIDLGQLYTAAKKALVVIDNIGDYHQFTADQITAANMTKLEGKRYKAGYSDKAAAERADKA